MGALGAALLGAIGAGVGTVLADSTGHEPVVGAVIGGGLGGLIGAVL